MSWLRAIYNFFYEIFFGCNHGHMTRPFTLQDHSYKVCLDCGRQIPYSLEKMRILHAWEIAKDEPAVAHLEPVPLQAAFAEPAFAEEDEYNSTRAVA
jgi:hypothetical protein